MPAFGRILLLGNRPGSIRVPSQFYFAAGDQLSPRPVGGGAPTSIWLDFLAGELVQFDLRGAPVLFCRRGIIESGNGGRGLVLAQVGTWVHSLGTCCGSGQRGLVIAQFGRHVLRQAGFCGSGREHPLFGERGSVTAVFCCSACGCHCAGVQELYPSP